MSYSSQRNAPGDPVTAFAGAGARPLGPAAVGGASVAAVLALTALAVLFFDQGQLMSPFIGEIAKTANYVHEFTHDARHLLGVPCH